MRQEAARPRRGTIAFAAVLAAAALAASGCGDRGRDRPAEGAAGLRRYTVRGEVVQLPPPAAGVRRAVVRHEAIDGFVDGTGATVGMAAMTMPFDVAPTVALDGVRAGDKVEMTLAVGWSPPVLRIDALRKLPPDTALEFRAARPPPATGPR
jgi:hypothetical protein